MLVKGATGTHFTCKFFIITHILMEYLFCSHPNCWWKSCIYSGLVTPCDDRSGSALAQVMAWCLTQCWFPINGVLWHSPESNFIGIAQDINEFENYTFKIIFTSIRGQWVNSSFPAGRHDWEPVGLGHRCQSQENYQRSLGPQSSQKESSPPWITSTFRRIPIQGGLLPRHDAGISEGRWRLVDEITALTGWH